jgi:hypothetical protein
MAQASSNLMAFSTAAGGQEQAIGPENQPRPSDDLELVSLPLYGYHWTIG